MRTTIHRTPHVRTPHVRISFRRGQHPKRDHSTLRQRPAPLARAGRATVTADPHQNRREHEPNMQKGSSAPGSGRTNPSRYMTKPVTRRERNRMVTQSCETSPSQYSNESPLLSRALK